MNNAMMLKNDWHCIPFEHYFNFVVLLCPQIVILILLNLYLWQFFFS